MGEYLSPADLNESKAARWLLSLFFGTSLRRRDQHLRIYARWGILGKVFLDDWFILVGLEVWESWLVKLQVLTISQARRQARPLQGHHLRALRRRSDAAEAAPERIDHIRPRRAGLALWFFKGVPTDGYLLDIAPRELEKSSTSQRRSSRTSMSKRARRMSTVSRTRSRPSPSRSTSTVTSSSPTSRSASLAAAYFADGKEKAFDEDDDFRLPRSRDVGEEQCSRRSRRHVFW